MQFVLNHLAGLDQVAKLPGFEDATPDTVERDPRGSGEVRDQRARSAQRVRRPRRRAVAGGRHGQDAGGLQGRLPAVLRERLERAHQESRVRRAGPAAARRHRGRGDVARVESRVRPVSAAHAGRHRGDRTARIAGAEGQVPAEDGARRMDRHDEPHRAAGRLRPRRGAHARRAAGRRHVQAAPARRSSSPSASTTTPRTSSTWCSRARRTRRRA